MHSFHQTRGRIFFEIFCALTIGAACALAWQQTGATALLAVSAVAALYSLVHATDAGRVPAVAAGPAPEPAPEPEQQGDLLAYVASPESPPAAEEAPKAPKAKKRGRKKLPDTETPAENDPEQPAELAASIGEPEAAQPEEEYHATVTPLFEPQPMVRQQRTVFGRKAG